MEGSYEQTFESVVERYRQKLTGAAYHMVGNKEAAFDVVQETLVDAFRGFDKIKEPEKAGAWLFAILRRKAADYYRKNRCHDELNDSKACRDSEVESMVRSIVIDQLSALPDEDREILSGKYLMGLSYRELSESLGVNEGTVRVRCLLLLDE